MAAGARPHLVHWACRRDVADVFHTVGAVDGIVERLRVSVVGNLTVTGTLEATGLTTVADGSVTKTSAAPTTDAMIANKKYVDDQVVAGGISWTTAPDSTTESGTAGDIAYDSSYVGELTDAAIAAGSIIYADLDTTDVNSLQIWGTYYINDGD